MGPMGPEHLGGMWIFPLIMLTVVLLIVYFVFGRGGFRPPWQDSSRPDIQARSSETAHEILEKRYAKGEITREEFLKMKKDLGAIEIS